MLNNEWDALVHLATVREPKLGTKLAALRALKKTRYNVQVGHPDASVRNEALTAIKVYKDILEACVQAVWGEALGIRVEAAAEAPAVSTEAVTAGASAEVQTGAPANSGASPASVDKYMSGMIQEIRRQIRDEFEAKYKAEQTRQDPKKIEADVLARVQESSRRASIEENLILVEGGAQILKEVWEIWSRVIASARGGLDDEITDLILEADSRVHSLALILARLMPAPKKDGKAS